MSYIPRGKVKTILDHMAQHGERDREWPTAEVAAIVEIETRAVASQLKIAKAHDMVFTRHVGRSTFYRLEPYPEPEPLPFECALWGDGDLVLKGLQVLDGNSVILKRENAAVVRRVLDGSLIPC